MSISRAPRPKHNSTAFEACASRLTPTRVPSLSEPRRANRRRQAYRAFPRVLRLRRERSRPRTAVVRANGRWARSLGGNGAQTTTIVRSERSSFADFEISQPSSPLVRLRHPKPTLTKFTNCMDIRPAATKLTCALEAVSMSLVATKSSVIPRTRRFRFLKTRLWPFYMNTKRSTTADTVGRTCEPLVRALYWSRLPAP